VTNRIAFFLAFVITLLCSGITSAQSISPPLDLPSEPRDEIPFQKEERVEPEIEPSPPTPPVEPTPRFVLRTVRIVGNRSLQPERLRELAAPFVGRQIGQAELEKLREAMTHAYVDAGYVTSGALIPDQDLTGGELVVQIVEGRIATIRVEGNARLRATVLSARIWPDPEAPLNVGQLGERLSILQADPDIVSVDAELRPGDRLGESRLVVRIVEGSHHDLAVEANNHRSPAIGSYTGVLRGQIRSLIGLGESLGLRGQLSEGLYDLGIDTSFPLLPNGPRLLAGFRIAESEVVEAPFDVLDIESDFLSFTLGLRQTVYESFRDRVEIGIDLEWRRGRTTLSGDGFSFTEGPDRGKAIVAPLRLEANWARRSPRQAIGVRSILSIGLPILDATDVRGSRVDARYLSWILQTQLAQRLQRLLDSELIARGNLQLTSDPVLPLERFSIGGYASTRGFRENQIVRDQGVTGSLELRVPVWQHADGRPILQVAPFFDVGHAWDHPDRDGTSAKTLAAAGLSFRAFPHDSITAVLSWAQRMTKADRPRKDKDPQDYGIHFSVTAALP
jgi:hemolysin activation/secretion protein